MKKVNIMSEEKQGWLNVNFIIALASTFILIISALLMAFLVSPGFLSDKDKTETSDDNNKSGITPTALERHDEIRGVWIATVGNINFPSAPGLPADKLQAELDDIVTTSHNLGFNTIFFQVRPTSDAFYDSDIFPVSEFLTGEQGSSLPDGFDVLEYLIRIAHEKDISVFAWINPLRVTSTMNNAYKQNSLAVLAPTNPASLYPSMTVTYTDNTTYYNPGLPEVRNLVADGVSEIVKNYEVDGIVFDDYFYPYPKEGAVFDDSASYALYGNGLSLEDWRRQNINNLVEECYNAVKELKSSCAFGIAPFGIWQNDNGSNGGSATSGLNAYSAIYCDALAWIKGGYIDFISPQLYWQFSNEVAPYGTLVDWWDNALKGHDNILLIISHAAYRVTEWNSTDEIKLQVEYARKAKSYKGSIMYGYKALKNNEMDLHNQLNSVYNP